MRRLLALASLMIAACAAEAPEPRQPNIVLIVGDDHSYPDFGFMGSPDVETPHLDRLAASGSVLRNGYTTASICPPALRSLLTGLHPYQWNMKIAEQRKRGLERSWHRAIRGFETLPGLLAEQGYKSFQGGKLWEASYRIAGFTHGIQKPGDDPSRGGLGGQVGRRTMKPVFRFLDAHGNEPFFLWFAPKLPHLPHNSGERFRARYEGRGLSESAIAFYASVTRFDDAVGRLLARLREKGLIENSLVVYIADNGWDQRPHSDAGYRFAGDRGKLTMYDLGFRTPIIFSWPGAIPAGEVRDELVSSVDLFPTFLDYAGAPPRPERPGHSLRPLLEGRTTWPRDVVIGGMSKLRRTMAVPFDPDDPFPAELAFFLRERRWRYIWDVELGSEELYDIEADPRESTNLAAGQPQLTKKFRARIEAWQAEMRAPFLTTETARGRVPSAR